MSAFDYSTEAELFGYGAEAELLFARSRMSRRRSISYRRFDSAADAVRFAMEELPPHLLPGTCLEVDEERYGHEGIRRLYESANYPLARPAAA